MRQGELLDVGSGASGEVGGQDAQADKGGIRVVQAVFVQGGDHGVRGFLEHRRQGDQGSEGQGRFVRVVFCQARQEEAEGAEQGDGADGVLDVAEGEGHAFVGRSVGAKLGGSWDLDVVEGHAAVAGGAEGVEAVGVVDGEAWGVARDEEGAVALAAGGFAGHGEDEDRVGGGAVADPGFLAGDCYGFVFEGGFGGQELRVGADVGFGDGDGYGFGFVFSALFVGAELVDEVAVDELAASPGAGDAEQAGALDQGGFEGGYGGVGGLGG